MQKTLIIPLLISSLLLVSCSEQPPVVTKTEIMEITNTNAIPPIPIEPTIEM